MKLDWRRVILYAAIIGMEGCWLFILLKLLNEEVADGQLSVLGVLGLYPAAFVLNAWLLRIRWPKVCLRSISWLLWAVAMLVIVKVQLAGSLAWSDTEWLLSIPQAIAESIYFFKPELLVLLITAVIWWLGSRLSRLSVNFGTLLGEFQFGLIILIVVFLIASLLKTEISNPVLVALTFFLFALIGISIAHALEGNSWLTGLYQGHWSGLLLVSIGVILVLGLLISLILTPEFLQVVWAAIKGAWEFIWGVIMKILDFFAGLFSASELGELPTVTSIPATEVNDGFSLNMPEWLRGGLNLAWIILVIGITIFALWRISSDVLRWLRRKLAGMAGAEFEPLPGAFKSDILGLLKRVLSKILGIKRLFHLRARSAPVRAEVSTVVRIYRQFLRWAAGGGHPRHLSQTPYEYCCELSGIMPEAGEDFDLVTLQYVKARYGAWLTTEDELNKLSQALQRVQKIRLKKVKTKHTYDKEVSEDG